MKRKRYFITLLISGIITLLCSPLYAATPIATVQDLQAMNNDLSEDYYLVSNIDASDTVNWNGGQGFEPIGSQATPFTGSLDGRGYLIQSLTINRSGVNYLGLFDSVNGGELKNITLENPDISGFNNIGALAAQLQNTTTTNCHIIGGSVYASGGGSAGICSRNHSGSIVSDCSVIGTTVSSDVNLAASLIAMSYTNTIVTNCFAKNTTISADYFAGGLIGDIYDNATVKNSYVLGGTVSTGSYASGGLLHRIGHPTIGTNNSQVSNCYAQGVTVSSTGNIVGGLVADCREGAYIENAYAACPVSGTADVGGLIGIETTNVTYVGTYWDYSVSGIAQNQDTGTNGDQTGIFSESTAIMQTQSTFVGWNFECVWMMKDYPHLRANANEIANADMVDGLHAYSTATPNALYTLDNNSQFTDDVIPDSITRDTEITDAMDNYADTTVAFKNKTITDASNSISVAVIDGAIPVDKGGTGSLNGSIVGTTALSLSAGGTDQDITLNPSGTADVVVNGDVNFTSFNNRIKWEEAASGQYITENWGIELHGEATTPIQIPDSSLLVGFDQSDNIDRGTGNLMVSGNTGMGTDTPLAKLHIVANDPEQLRIQRPGETTHLLIGSGTNSAMIEAMSPTNDNEGILFRIDHDEVMRATKSGRIGIGTATPEKKLHIYGEDGSMMLETTDSVNFSQMEFRSDNSAFNIGTGGSATQHSGDFYVFDATTNTDRFVIKNSGNVGIGTTTPESKLHIVANDPEQLRIQRPGASPYFLVESGTNGAVLDLRNPSATNEGITFKVDGNEHMRLTDSGYLGIGTSNPTVALEIIGTAKCTDLQTTTLNGETPITTANIELSETDPSVGTNVENYISKWDGNALIQSAIYDNGQIGIGTNAPESKLHIVANDPEQLRIQRPGASPYFLVESGTNGAVLDLRNPSASNEGITFKVDGNERMRLTDNGYLGIGTSNPQRSLHINDVLRLEPRATAPSNPQTGDMYVGTDNHIYCFLGTQWKQLDN